MLSVACDVSGLTPSRSEERRVGKECRSLCDWSSDVCSSYLDLCSNRGLNTNQGGSELAHECDVVSRLRCIWPDTFADRPRSNCRVGQCSGKSIHPRRSWDVTHNCDNSTPRTP